MHTFGVPLGMLAAVAHDFDGVDAPRPRFGSVQRGRPPKSKRSAGKTGGLTGAT